MLRCLLIGTQSSPAMRLAVALRNPPQSINPRSTMSNGAIAMLSESERVVYLTAAHVRERFGGVSHMWIVRKMRDAGFPDPVRFGGRLRYWRISDVVAWEQAMIAHGIAASRSAARPATTRS